MWVMHAQRLWGARVNSTSVNLCANVMTAKLCWLVIALTLVPSQPHRIGELPWNASASVPRSQAVMKRSLTRRGCQISSCRYVMSARQQKLYVVLDSKEP